MARYHVDSAASTLGTSKPLNVLRLAVEGERNQAVRLPVAGHNAPHRTAIREEVPLTGRFALKLLHTNNLAVPQVLRDRSDCLEGYD